MKIKQKKQLIQKLKIVGIALITIVLTAIVYFAEQDGIWFKASILEAPNPFNGTTLPVKKVPKWSYWNEQKALRYDQIPSSELVDLPTYDLNLLNFPSSQLVWGDSSQDNIRTSKITYSVVYMGNYKLDHIEGGGSHAAIDIKLPSGTPIHSIANGKVTKVSRSSSGFGHHVVVRHFGVPDPENPGVTTDLYSSYSHLDEILVSEGQNVLKGQKIATSGNTGTSTTPHLHFQIDRDTASWHPYWPFTSSEASAAGLGFFEAVNSGLGADNGRLHTVHPMNFIYKNINTSNGVLLASDKESNPQNENSNNGNLTDQSSAEDENKNLNSNLGNEIEKEEISVKEGSKTELFTYKIQGEKVSLINNGITLTVTDESNQIQNLSEEEKIEVKLSGTGKLLKNKFSKADFNNNTIKVVVKSDQVGTTNILIGKSSYQVQFIEKVKAAQTFKIEHDGAFQKGVIEKVKIIALDEDGNIAPTVNFPGLANLTVIEGEAELKPDQLQVSQFKNGVAEIDLISQSDREIKIKAQNGALVGTSEWIKPEKRMLFTDISSDHPNYLAIRHLKEKDILNGYSDGSFKPNQVVNRVEALKMLMLAFNIELNDSTVLNFNDIEPNAWYLPTLSSALIKGIAKGYDDGSFRPANSINRAEYLKILMKTGNVAIDQRITQPYVDVDTSLWFAPYAYQASKYNLYEPMSHLKADQFVSRAEVAETIYRLKFIQDNSLLTYSK